MKSLIYDLQIHELQTLLAELGQPAYRVKQIWQGLYKHYWQDPEEFTNLPKTLREQLGRALHFEALNTCQMRASCGSCCFELATTEVVKEKNSTIANNSRAVIALHLHAGQSPP